MQMCCTLHRAAIQSAANAHSLAFGLDYVTLMITALRPRLDMMVHLKGIPIPQIFLHGLPAKYAAKRRWMACCDPRKSSIRTR